VGLGSPLGSKIAIPADDARAGTAPGESFLRDRAGREVIAALDVTLLRRIADIGGGAYSDGNVDGNPAGANLVDLYERRIIPTARGADDARARRSRPSRFQWPLAGAFILWILALALGDTRRRDTPAQR
jgi:hypothetical protein